MVFVDDRHGSRRRFGPLAHHPKSAPLPCEFCVRYMASECVYVPTRCVKISSPSFQPRDILSVSFLIFCTFFFLPPSAYLLYKSTSCGLCIRTSFEVCSGGTSCKCVCVCVCVRARISVYVLMLLPSLFRVHFYTSPYPLRALRFRRRPAAAARFAPSSAFPHSWPPPGPRATLGVPSTPVVGR